MNYRYWTMQRPPMLGAIPKDGLIETYAFPERQKVMELGGREAWGYALYDRELSEKELSDYEMAAETARLYAVRVGTDGDIRVVEKPEDCEMLDFMYEQTECTCVDIVYCYRPQGNYMIVDDEALLKEDNPVNPIACWMYGTGLHGAPILGNVLVMAREKTEDDTGLMTLDDANILAEHLQKIAKRAEARFRNIPIPEPKFTIITY